MLISLAFVGFSSWIDVTPSLLGIFQNLFINSNTIATIYIHSVHVPK
jgi:hypothetical protein